MSKSEVLSDKQQLLMERSGKSIPEVLAEAYEAEKGNSIEACAWILNTYGVKVALGTYSEWVKQFNGRRSLEFPEPQEAAA